MGAFFKGVSPARMMAAFVLTLSLFPTTGAVAHERVNDLPDRVLVIRNIGSPASQTIAADYIKRRGIKHVLSINCQDAAERSELETLTPAAFEASIASPLQAYLKKHPEIDFIVLTKGIPLRIQKQKAEIITRYALDSQIAALGYEEGRNRRANMTYFAPGWPSFSGQAWVNSFWNSNKRFSHREFGGYLVTRLDGYTAADAMALTARAMEAERLLTTSGYSDVIRRPILLDMAASKGADWNQPRLHSSVSPVSGAAPPLEVKGDSPWKDFNSDMILAARSLAKRDIAVMLESSDWFAGFVSGLMGYVSFGSNDPKYRVENYRSLSFAPGALAETAVSTGGRTFLPRAGGQSLIADLVAQGVTGVKGYSDEQLLKALASPTILFDRYVRGWTLAESYYAASAFVGWTDIVVGDPIARAYPLCDCQPLYEETQVPRPDSRQDW